MKKIVFALVMLVCAGVFVLGLVPQIRYLSDNKKAESAFEALRPTGLDDTGGDGDGSSGTEDGIAPYDALLPHYLSLFERNDDFVGWLKIPGMDVDYPVMQTTENPEYYLKRDFEGNVSASGTLFVSAQCDIDTKDGVVVINGHHMKTGTMFGSLKKLTDAEFLKGHETIYFDTLGGRGKYRIVCVFTEQVNTDSASEFRYYAAGEFESAAEYDEYVSEAMRRAVARTDAVPVYGEPLLVLSTCEYAHEDGRLAVLAVRTRE